LAQVTSAGAVSVLLMNLTVIAFGRTRRD